ncbi:MAG: OmpH family outer membrane protein [Alphaproteobacteria bacterium]|nr:MAG: hypothetical protein B6I23_02940 [Rickettsiaceae bacterium 4572_127]
MSKKNQGLKKKIIIFSGIIIALALVIFGITLISSSSSSSLKNISSDEIVEQGTPYMAIIDMYKITTEATALKGLNEQRKNYAEKLKKEASRKEEALMKAKKDIESKQSVLSKEALQKKAQEYQKSLMDYQKDMSEKSAGIEKSYREALQKVQKGTLDGVINDVAKKKKVTIVLNSSQAILLNPVLNITEDIIKVLNNRLPKVHMATPKGF